MRVFLNQPFVRFARREGIEDSALLEAVARADRGLIDADMGSGLVKQRVPRPNEGRSGGYRCLLAYRREHVTVFIHGFAKNERDNISPAELRILRELAKEYLALADEEFEFAIAQGKLLEITEAVEPNE